MRRGWKRVAERGDKHAFTSEEVSNEIILALEQDCRVDLRPRFLDGLCGLFREQESSLFKDRLGSQLEQLRGIAGAGIGPLLLDYAIQCSERGETGLDGAVKAVTAALIDRAARGARQVEEHYYRKSTEQRALNVRARIEKAIGNVTSAMEGLARRMLKVDAGPSVRVPKNQGLDEGVKF
jgi:hypothetical protein